MAYYQPPVHTEFHDEKTQTSCVVLMNLQSCLVVNKFLDILNNNPQSANSHYRTTGICPQRPSPTVCQALDEATMVPSVVCGRKNYKWCIYPQTVQYLQIIQANKNMSSKTLAFFYAQVSFMQQ